VVDDEDEDEAPVPSDLGGSAAGSSGGGGSVCVGGGGPASAEKRRGATAGAGAEAEGRARRRAAAARERRRRAAREEAIAVCGSEVLGGTAARAATRIGVCGGATDWCEEQGPCVGRGRGRTVVIRLPMKRTPGPEVVRVVALVR
jgi:hypothetical protein